MLAPVLDFLHTALAFVAAISLLVAVHEYGHFATARALGVRVLRYSIGFGPKLLGWQRNGTEYWISAVPFGGYVKMLDEREGEVAPAELPLAYNRQPPWKRMLIVAAGPGVNFLFAIVAYAALYLYGTEGLRTMVERPPEGTPAQLAGLKAGDEILAVDGKPMRDWQQLRLQLLRSAMTADEVTLQVRDVHGGEHVLTLTLPGLTADPAQLQQQLGLNAPRPKIPPVLGEVMPGSPAEQAGLRAGDRLLTLDGQPVLEWADVVRYIAARPGVVVRATYQPADPAAMIQSVELPLESIEERGQRRGRMGAAVEANPGLWQDWRARYTLTLRLSPGEALMAAIDDTWSMSVLTLGMFWQMIAGQVSWSNVSGPLQIAEYAGATASIGVSAFLAFLGLVSVSLGVLNLLPIPLLDGGHLLFDACEWIRGRPLTERVQQFGQRVGMTFLFALMSLALYNDLARLLGNS